LNTALERLHDALGGARFSGNVLDPNGLVLRGTLLLVGPVAIFRSAGGELVGTVEQRLGSLEPSVIPFADPRDSASALQAIDSGTGLLPLDPTLGNAHKLEATQETIVQHMMRGGTVMYPLLGLAAAALLVALYKWARLMFVRSPSQRRIAALLAAVARQDRGAALNEAKAMRGPGGAMLTVGVEHLEEPRELIEELMFECVLATRLRLQSMLPFIAICASSAPLLGLLGTVTGIMNTFTLMTVFGTGDVKTLSSGISEALITTEYGLIVAIPSLLIHAFLSRKSRAVIDRMEKAAIALVNQIGKTPFVVEREVLLTPKPPESSQAQVAAPVATLQTAAN
jgi:biopolymer transport protein ExbB